MEKIGWMIVLVSIISLFISKETFMKNSTGEHQDIEFIFNLFITIPWYLKLILFSIGIYLVKDTFKKPEEENVEELENDLNNYTVLELKEECKSRGLVVSGRKQELIDRINEYDLNAD